MGFMAKLRVWYFWVQRRIAIGNKPMLNNSPLLNFIGRSLLSGFLIGLGCLVYVVCENRYVGAFLFALGLLTILIKGYYLYTGRVGDWVPRQTLILLAMFCLNGLGAALSAYLFTFTRLDLSAVDTIVSTKLQDSLWSIFILAIGCGAMMHLAVFNFKQAKHPLYVIMPIMFFIICGFEHCVANSGYFAMAKVPLTLDLLVRLAVMVLGNAVGSLIFTKFIHVPLTTSK